MLTINEILSACRQRVKDADDKSRLMFHAAMAANKAYSEATIASIEEWKIYVRLSDISFSTYDYADFCLAYVNATENEREALKVMYPEFEERFENDADVSITGEV